MPDTHAGLAQLAQGTLDIPGLDSQPQAAALRIEQTPAGLHAQVYRPVDNGHIFSAHLPAPPHEYESRMYLEFFVAAGNAVRELAAAFGMTPLDAAGKLRAHSAQLAEMAAAACAALTELDRTARMTRSTRYFQRGLRDKLHAALDWLPMMEVHSR